MRSTIVAISLAGLTAACAPTLEPEVLPRRPGMFVTHGRDVADLRCAACHSIDTYTSSPRSGAPPFRNLRIRFNTITWKRAMAAIAEGGHDEMPAVHLDDIEIRDLGAFIDTLR